MDSISLDQANGLSYSGPPPIMNPPPQIFGGYTADGEPLSESLQAGMFSDEQFYANGDDLGGQGDAKRRRIARVGISPYTMGWKVLTNASRHAICVARKRSSAMGNSRVGTARITRPNAFLRMSRRNGILRKGLYDSETRSLLLLTPR